MQYLKLSSGVRVETHLVENGKFYRPDFESYGSIVFTTQYTFDEYITEKRTTEAVLRKELSKLWKVHDDFEVADDENMAFTMCGSIYSGQAICLKYIECLHSVLQSTRMRDRWIYTTSIELDFPIQGMQLCEFRLRGHSLFINADDIGDFDLVAALSSPYK